MMVAGCSASMAAKGPKKKDISVLNVGTDRHRVVAELGAPVIAEVVDGKKVDTFNFIQGSGGASKAGRSFFHGAADVLTVGLWELVATPLEGAIRGTEVQVVVYYDESDHISRTKVLEGAKKLKDVNSDNLPNIEGDSGSKTDPADQSQLREQINQTPEFMPWGTLFAGDVSSSRPFGNR